MDCEFKMKEPTGFNGSTQLLSMIKLSTPSIFWTAWIWIQKSKVILLQTMYSIYHTLMISKGRYALHYTISLKNLPTKKIALSNLAYLLVMDLAY